MSDRLCQLPDNRLRERVVSSEARNRVRGFSQLIDRDPSPAFDASHLRHPLPQGERVFIAPLSSRQFFTPSHHAQVPDISL